jgi:integrase
MSSVFRPAGKSKYVIVYFDENGKRRKKTGATDKQVTERIARDIENRVALRREGLIDAAFERFSESERKPLRDHLDDFITSLQSRGRDDRHIRSTRTYIERIITVSHIERFSHLTPSAATIAIGALETKLKLSARAVNAHATAIKALARWAWKDGRIRAYELGNIGRRNEQAHRKYIRRPLTEAELRKLIATTRTAPQWKRMNGVDRSWFYALGAATGFRRSELGALRPEDFEIKGPNPIVRLVGSQTKNGQHAEQPLPVGLAAELRTWLLTKAPGSPVFALPEKTARMLHADLRRCNIEPVDSQGRVVDTHSLRHGYVSALARAGVPIKVAQTLARHSDPKLTMNVYSHLTAFDLHGAIANAIPDLTTESVAAEAVATGTGGTPLVGSSPRATQSATLPNRDEARLRSSQGVKSIRQMSLNQRVVGSSPTGGISDNRRQDTTDLVQVVC